ncbi:ribonuclease H-like domain-containing protein [Tanacetum coccineum]
MVDEEVPTNMALMAFSDSEVLNDKACSNTCLKSFETLKTQYDNLRIEFNKSEFDLATYKRGLAFVEEQLVFYKKNEVMFTDQIVVLKRDTSFKDSKINALNIQIEKLKKEKESNLIKIDNFEKASKSLNKLIGSQITNKSRKVVGFESYNAVAPLPTGLFAPLTIDLSNSGLKEFQQPDFEDMLLTVLTKSGIVPISTARQRSSRAATPVSAARPINIAAPKPFGNYQTLPNAFQKKNNVLFTETECLILSPDFKLPDKSQVMLKIPRKYNMYSFDLKNIVPSKGLTCLFAKATNDESKLWHRRLGHINFKTMNKLVKGNLVIACSIHTVIIDPHGIRGILQDFWLKDSSGYHPLRVLQQLLLDKVAVDGQPPLGWSDTFAYLVLHVLLVVSQYISVQNMQSSQPQSNDPNMKTSQAITRFLPLMIGYFALSVPSGLSLYCSDLPHLPPASFITLTPCLNLLLSLRMTLLMANMTQIAILFVVSNMQFPPNKQPAQDFLQLKGLIARCNDGHSLAYCKPTQRKAPRRGMKVQMLAVAFMAKLGHPTSSNTQSSPIEGRTLDSDAETEIDDLRSAYHQYLLDTEAQNVPTEVSTDTSDKEKILTEKKELADSYLDEIVCLKTANKVARDMLQRFNMPTQTIPMLSKKPKKATADLHKDILGTRNPGLGYMAKRAQPVLYDADTLLHPTHHPVSIWDSEEVLVHQVVSMKKMSEKPGHVRPANGFYDKLNALKFVPQQELSREQAYWLPANERASQTSNPNSPVTPFVRKSRPPSQVLASLRKINAVFPQFEGIIKERTTQQPDYVSEWCYDYAKQFVEQQLVPFYDHFKKHIQAANETFFKEIREFEQIFDELEAEYEQCVLDNKNLTIEKKNLLIKNDCLIAECLEKDICSIVLTSDIVVPPSSNCLCDDLRSACDREHTKVLELEAEVFKQQKMVIESEKRNSHLQKNHIDLQLKFQNYKQCIDTSSASNAIFEINKLRNQLQGKDDTIRNLDAQINIMKVLNVGSTEGSCDQQALDTDRIQLKDTITSLRIQLDGYVVQIVLWYLDSGCSRHMTGDRARLINFVEKFIGTVRFGNDEYAASLAIVNGNGSCESDTEDGLSVLVFLMKRAYLGLHNRTELSKDGTERFMAKADIGFFVGFAPPSRRTGIYNKRSVSFRKTVHGDLDELRRN